MRTLEFNKIIKKNKVIYWFFSYSLNTFFYLIRKFNKLYSINEGNVVILSFHKLGDAVFTIPAIREIQKIYSNKKIIVFCFSNLIPIYKIGLSSIRFCQVYNNELYFNKRIFKLSAKRKLKLLKPEIIYDLTGAITSASLIFNSKAKMIVGTGHKHFKNIYDKYTPLNRRPHLMDMYIDVVSLMNENIKRENIKLFTKKTEAKNKILIHPFAGWRAKEWNFNKFIKLAEKLNNEYYVSIIAPVGRIPNDVLIEIKAKYLNIVETKSIGELVINIQECGVFIGNDSGSAHIANLLGKSTFTIYGPTNPEYCGPLGYHNTYLIKKIKCTPSDGREFCFTNGGRSGCPSFECMNQLSFEEVYSDLLNFLDNIDFERLT